MSVVAVRLVCPQAQNSTRARSSRLVWLCGLLFASRVAETSPKLTNPEDLGVGSEMTMASRLRVSFLSEKRFELQTLAIRRLLVAHLCVMFIEFCCWFENQAAVCTTKATAMSTSENAGRKVLLIGWDAADWKVITPLLDAGKMPNLERLVNGGVMGNIATLMPVLSPMLWTSIATGKRADKHGIHGFSEPDPATGSIRPITNLSRKTKAVWNILNQNGKQSNVIGWWPSFPAEPLNGVMVADQFKSPPGKLEDPWPMRRGFVHPPELAEHMAPMRIHPYELAQEHILPFVPRADEIDQEKDKRLVNVARSIAECSTIHAVATATMQLEPWDFMAVYYDAIDHFSHGFMKYHPPQQEHISDEDFELYKNVIEGAYRYHDMMLGVLMQLAGEETTIILMSDHGFHPDHLRPATLPNEPAGPAGEHRNYGIFVMKGPGIKQDERVYGTTLLDVAPTILTLFGLPVGADMDGKVIGSAFNKTPTIETVESWDLIEGDSGQHAPETQLDAVESQEAINQLVALGYIEKPDENKEKAIDNTVRELQHNLARAYIDANRHHEAIAIYEKLWEKFPDQNRFGVKLIECYLAIDANEQARLTMTKLVERKSKYATEAQEELKRLSEELKDVELDDYSDEQRHRIRTLRAAASTNFFTLSYLDARLLRAEEKNVEALEKLKEVESVSMHYRADVFLQQGEIHLKLQQWNEAEEAFQKALEIDPDNASGHLGLCRSYLPRRKNRMAAEAALNSLSLVFHNPRGHYFYAIALHRCGHLESSVSALKTAIQQNPNFPDAHERLARILENRYEDKTKAALHRNQARLVKERIAAMKAGKPLESGESKPEISPVDIRLENIFGRVNAPQDEVITIVSGLPRSGTSMMMQILKAGGLSLLIDEARLADEDNPKGYFEFEPVKRVRNDKSWLDQARGKVVKVIAQLVPHLPANYQYRIIFMNRDLHEILASQSTMLRRSKLSGGEMNEAGLARTFIKQVNAMKKLVSTHPRIDLFNANYRELVESPEETIQQVAEFLDLPLLTEAMASTIDASLYRRKRAK